MVIHWSAAGYPKRPLRVEKLDRVTLLATSHSQASEHHMTGLLHYIENVRLPSDGAVFVLLYCWLHDKKGIYPVKICCNGFTLGNWPKQK